MHFELTEEQRRVRDRARDFAEKEVRPLARIIDESGEFPWETIKKMAKLKLLGLPIPEKYGGAGTDSISYAMAVEEISRACSSTGVIMAVHTSVGSYPIYLFGDEDQKERFLKPLTRGERIGAFALTEPTAGSDVAAVKTTARREGDEYIIDGSKIFITNGSIAGNVVVLTMTDKSKGYKGMSTFIVEKGTEGFTYGVKEEKLGMNASDTSELIFDNCHVPKENLLGGEGMGFKIAMIALDSGRIGIAAQALGVAQSALDESLKYAKERSQYGKPIAKLQAIQWMIANMATKIEAARLLIYRAAFLKDKNVRFSKEAAISKVYASEVAMRATTKAVQIHGGQGYIKGSAVERLFRDAKVLEIYEGTSEIQRLVISSNLIKR